MMNRELQMYVRKHPKWFIVLSREPWRIADLQKIYKQEHNQTFGAKLDQLSMVLSMMEMMM